MIHVNDMNSTSKKQVTIHPALVRKEEFEIKAAWMLLSDLNREFNLIVVYTHTTEVSSLSCLSCVSIMFYLFSIHRLCPACQLCQARGSLRVAPAAQRMDKTLRLLRFAIEISFILLL